MCKAAEKTVYQSKAVLVDCRKTCRVDDFYKIMHESIQKQKVVSKERFTNLKVSQKHHML